MRCTSIGSLSIILWSTRQARGQVYDDYCADAARYLEHNRRIPLLSDAAIQLRPQLVQVQVVSRHGARTPSDFHQGCWKGYRPTWDCQPFDRLTVGSSSDEVTRLDWTELDKHFDASPVSNVFQGTCQRGQLIEEGIQQHVLNGQILAEAYLIEQGINRIPYPTAAPLLNLDSDSVSKNVYLRSSDMQRTRMSAAVLFSSCLRHAAYGSENKFSPTLHTVDLENDYIFSNPAVCKAAKDIHHNFRESKEYNSVRNSHKDLIRQLREVLGNPTLGRDDDKIWPGKLFDCMMTSTCESSHRVELPKGFEPNSTLFKETYLAVERESVFPYVWKTNRLSRVAMKKFLLDIRRHLQAATQPSESNDPPLRLLLWSGHDTTVLPLLAALGGKVFPGQWPGYASLIILEVFQVESTPPPSVRSYYFRLLFNGDDRTSFFPGCETNEERVSTGLCPVSVFLSSTDWTESATIDSCDEQAHSLVSMSSLTERIPFAWDSPALRLLLFLTTIVLSAVISSSVTRHVLLKDSVRMKTDNLNYEVQTVQRGSLVKPLRVF